MEKSSIPTINNDNKLYDCDASEIKIFNNPKKENNTSSSNKSLSFISNNRNVSNFPLIDSSSELNFLKYKSHNKCNNNDNFFRNNVIDFSQKTDPEILNKIKTFNSPVEELKDIHNKSYKKNSDNDIDSNKNNNINIREKKKVNFFLEEKDKHVKKP